MQSVVLFGNLVSDGVLHFCAFFFFVSLIALSKMEKVIIIIRSRMDLLRLKCFILLERGDIFFDILITSNHPESFRNFNGCVNKRGTSPAQTITTK